MSTFGSMIRDAREVAALGLREAARRAKISPAYLSRVETGHASPPPEGVVRRIAKVLGCEPVPMLAAAAAIRGHVDVSGLSPLQIHDIVARVERARAGGSR